MRVRGGALGMLVMALSACDSSLPAADVSVYPPSITLQPMAWSDPVSPWNVVSVLNETYFILDVTQVEVTGPGAALLEVEALPNAPIIDLRQTLQIRVRVKPPTPDQVEKWSSNIFEASLKFTVGGSGVIDPNTQLPDPTKRTIEKIEVPIRFELECDLDRDGYDAAACGGLDCRDDLILVNPSATDFCDGFDNNCSGRPDDTNCVDLDK